MSKKSLSLFLRILIAALGIGFIAWSVTWQDQVTFPTGTTLPDGSTQVKPSNYRVLSGAPKSLSGLEEQGGFSQPVEVAVPSTNGTTVRVSINANRFGMTKQDYHYVPGVLHMIAQANLKWLLIGFLMVGLIVPIQMVRWWLLLRARGIDVKLSMVGKLTLVGNFFNYCMPGTTGGDLVKGYYAAQRKDRRADAVMTVLMDRIVGLFGLVMLAAIVSPFVSGNTMARQIAINLWIFIALATVGSALYFSRRIRRFLHIDGLIAMLPGKNILQTVDQAAMAYRSHIGVIGITLLMSLLVHSLLCTGTALAGYALGMQTPLDVLLSVLPVLFLASAIPLSYQGIGVMEGLAMAMLLAPPHTTTNHIVGMLLMCRIFQLVYSLIGSIYVIRGNVHMHPENVGVGETSPVAN